MNAFDLDTPAAYVDLDVLEKNIGEMQRRCREWKVGLRPQAKTHKIPEIGRMQLAAGAIGLTFAKVGEAEVMPGDDLLIGFPILADRLPRLQALARTRRVTVAVDSVEAARGLPGIRTLVELEVGARRCGVRSPEAAVEVARACADFQGLFYYPAGLDDAGFHAAREQIAATLTALARAGLEARIVSGGTTPGAPKTPLVPQTTEIRPGTYVFNDATTIARGCCAEADCALRILVTVVSTAVPAQCVIDGGSKTFSNDSTEGSGTFGIFSGKPWTMSKMNEEHGFVTVEAEARVGEKVWVIPSHVCTAVNMHNEIWFGRAGRVEGKWTVAARGKVR